jgi:hypothetical protein
VSVARLSILGKNITVRARIDLASALFAPNVPNAWDGVAVLALRKSSATTAVIEVDKGINTLVIATNQTGDRAGRETFRARGNIAGTVFTLLHSNALVVTTTVPVIPVLALALVLVVITVRLSRSLRWSRGLCCSGRGRGRLATEGASDPTPTIRALGRREGIRWLVRGTASLPGVPRPVEGAVRVSGWAGRFVRPSLRKTEVLRVPLEFTPSTVVPVGENKGDGQNQEHDASNE